MTECIYALKEKTHGWMNIFRRLIMRIMCSAPAQKADGSMHVIYLEKVESSISFWTIIR